MYSDIIRKTKRNGENSSDKDLTPITYNDLLDLRNNFQKVNAVYCTSGGGTAIRLTSSVSAGSWLLTSLSAQLGCSVTGFNFPGYKKDIIVNLNNVVIWKFKLYILLSPSNGANAGFQGQVNADLQLQTLIANLPPAFAGQGDPMKLRIAQWSYLLSLGGFQLIPSLQAYVTMNLPLLALKFA
ncbi:MAG: hypothetical protein K9I70_09300 [Chitinophagaceae bacterium]|nr:hypothetical protein [Chitinophagaceae bacterium]